MKDDILKGRIAQGMPYSPSPPIFTALTMALTPEGSEMDQSKQSAAVRVEDDPDCLI